MSNEIKKLGDMAVMEYEKRNGRKPVLHEKDGYDIISSSSGQEVRHIEVKATKKSRFFWRYLTENEFKALLNDPHYYLYLVTDVTSQPKIRELRRDALLVGYKRCEVQHIFTFPKELVTDESDEV